MTAHPNLAELLYLAMAEDIGIVVATDDPIFLRNKLYPLRKELPEMAILSFVISPLNQRDLWIMKKLIPTEVLNGSQG